MTLSNRSENLTISVLTPSYNSLRYIERAIVSVRRQDYPHWEHIIMDGGSADGTTDVLKRYKHLVWESEKDHGQSHAMNKAFARSSGALIVYLNADDELEEGLFTRMVQEFGQYPETDLVAGNLRTDSDGVRTLSSPAVGLGDLLEFQTFRFPLNPVSYMYRRSLQHKTGLFPETNHYTMDYWFLLRAGLLGRIRKIDFTCGTFYFDGANKSADKARALVSLAQVRTQFLLSYFYHPAVMRWWMKKRVYEMKRTIKKLLS